MAKLNVPFISHMSFHEASQLQIGHTVDHRDDLGRYLHATVIDKHGTELTLHYIGWSNYWDCICDIKTDLTRLSKPQSISKRPTYTLNHLDINSIVLLRPTLIPGHNIHTHLGRIMSMDKDSGQVRILYKFNNRDCFYWSHLDNTDEIAEITDKRNKKNNKQSKSSIKSPKLFFSKNDLNQSQHTPNSRKLSGSRLFSNFSGFRGISRNSRKSGFNSGKIDITRTGTDRSRNGRSGTRIKRSRQRGRLGKNTAKYGNNLNNNNKYNHKYSQTMNVPGWSGSVSNRGSNEVNNNSNGRRYLGSYGTNQTKSSYANYTMGTPTTANNISINRNANYLTSPPAYLSDNNNPNTVNNINNISNINTMNNINYNNNNKSNVNIQPYSYHKQFQSLPQVPNTLSIARNSNFIDNNHNYPQAPVVIPSPPHGLHKVTVSTPTVFYPNLPNNSLNNNNFQSLGTQFKQENELQQTRPKSYDFIKDSAQNTLNVPEDNKEDSASFRDESTELVTEYDYQNSMRNSLRTSMINSPKRGYTDRSNLHSANNINNIHYLEHLESLEQLPQQFDHFPSHLGVPAVRMVYNDEHDEEHIALANRKHYDYYKHSPRSKNSNKNSQYGPSSNEMTDNSIQKTDISHISHKSHNHKGMPSNGYKSDFKSDGEEPEIYVAEITSSDDDGEDNNLIVDVDNHLEWPGKDDDEDDERIMNEIFDGDINNYDWNKDKIDGFWNYPIPPKYVEKTWYEKAYNYIHGDKGWRDCIKLLCVIYCLWIPAVCFIICTIFGVDAYLTDINELMTIFSLVWVTIMIIWFARILFWICCVILNLNNDHNESLQISNKYTTIIISSIIWTLSSIFAFLYPMISPFISLWICRWFEKRCEIESHFHKVSTMAGYIDFIISNSNYNNNQYHHKKYQSILRYILNLRLLQFYTTISVNTVHSLQRPLSIVNALNNTNNANNSNNSSSNLNTNRDDEKLQQSEKYEQMELTDAVTRRSNIIAAKFMKGGEFDVDQLQYICNSLWDINISDKLWKNSIFYPFYELNWIDYLLTILTCIAHIIMIFGSEYNIMILFSFTLLFSLIAIGLSRNEWKLVKTVHSNIHPKVLKYCIFVTKLSASTGMETDLLADVSGRKWMERVFYKNDKLKDVIQSTVFWYDIKYFIAICWNLGDEYKIDIKIGNIIKEYIDSIENLDKFMKTQWKVGGVKHKKINGFNSSKNVLSASNWNSGKFKFDSK